MAANLAPHLSYKSALALLPPAHLVAPIEAVRRVADKNFARWPPHINLIYPFLASPSELLSREQSQGDERLEQSSVGLKQDIRIRIERAVKNIDPFHVALAADPPGTFSHSKKSKTVWIGPSAQAVQQLQAALQAEFAECDADQRPFTPHLSVGQAHSDNGARKLGNDIKQSVSDFLNNDASSAPVELPWYIDQVFVIERKGFHGRFKVVGTIDLGN